MIAVNHDERARQDFAFALNRYVQTTLAEGSRRTCDRVAPALGVAGIAAAHGLFDPAAVDAYEPDAATAQARAAERQAAIARVLGVLGEEVARLRGEGGGA